MDRGSRINPGRIHRSIFMRPPDMVRSVVVGLAIAAITAAGFVAGVTQAAHEGNDYPYPDHVMLRRSVITSQLLQAPNPKILVIGDSIVEGLLFSPVDGIVVVNGGIGTIKTSYFASNMKVFLDARPMVVVVAVGINDCTWFWKDEINSDKWRAQYLQIVDEILKSHAIPVLTTILPVERNKPFGDKTFDSQLIKKRNAWIRTLARDRRIPLIDTWVSFAGPNDYMPQGATIDGVHLTQSSYVKMRAVLNGICVSMTNAGLQCPANKSLRNISHI